MLVGLTTGVYLGNFGLRASGAAAMHAYQLEDQRPLYSDDRVSALAGDLDLVLKPGRRAGAAGAYGSLDPRVFGGVGVRGDRFEGRDPELHTVLTFGTTFSYSLLSRLRLEGEARRVVPMERAAELLDDPAAVGGWEFRGGLALHFGKGALRPTPGLLDALPIPGTGGAAGRARREGRGRIVVDIEPGTVLHTADTFVGSPYLWGGDSPRQGFDCSGFLKHVFDRHGVPLPRTSREMARVGDAVPGRVEAMRPGDLMFFAENGDGRITHVAMYVGNQMMIHSSKSGGGVGYDDLGTPRGRWFERILVGGRRVIGAEIPAPRVRGAVAGDVPRARHRAERGRGIDAFLAAAGLRDLSALAKRLYEPHERPDPPDNAPKRRW